MRRMVLWIVSLFLTTLHFCTPLPSKVCPELKITNVNEATLNFDISSYGNCSIIDGSIFIVNLDITGRSDLYFPNIREVNGGLGIMNVTGLRTLRNIFPNLSLIRGIYTEVILDISMFFLKVYDMQEIGLPMLTTIEGGFIHVNEAPKICFIETVNWKALRHEKIQLVSRRDKILPHPQLHEWTVKNQDECLQLCSPKCFTKKMPYGYCWSHDDCQRLCDSECGSQGCYNAGSANERCCHKECLSGCDGPGQDQCWACKHFLEGDTCVESCSSNRPYEISIRGRFCVTRKECQSGEFFHGNIGVIHRDNKNCSAEEIKNSTTWKDSKIYKNQCLLTCPDGTKPDGDSCIKCGAANNPCIKHCKELVITAFSFMNDALEDNCTDVLSVSILLLGDAFVDSKENFDFISTLERKLSKIRHIGVFLGIENTNALHNLTFFRNLQTIGRDRSQYSSRTVEEYPVVKIAHCNKLTSLFEPGSTPKISSPRDGELKITIAYNPRLCQSLVDSTLAESLQFQANTSDAISVVTKQTNGVSALCTFKNITLNVSVGYFNVTFRWSFNETDLGDLIFTLFVREISNDADAIILDDAVNSPLGVWASKDMVSGRQREEVLKVSVDASKKNLMKSLSLKAVTRYAAYMRGANGMQDSTGVAYSDILYFKTSPFRPTKVRPFHVDKSPSNRISISFDPPSHPNGVIDQYIIFYKHISTAVEIKEYPLCAGRAELNQRNRVKSQAEVSDQPGITTVNGSSVRNPPSSGTCQGGVPCQCPDSSDIGRRPESSSQFFKTIRGEKKRHHILDAIAASDRVWNYAKDAACAKPGTGNNSTCFDVGGKCVPIDRTIDDLVVEEDSAVGNDTPQDKTYDGTLATDLKQYSKKLMIDAFTEDGYSLMYIEPSKSIAVIENLSSFESYDIKFYACLEHNDTTSTSLCSDEMPILARTAPMVERDFVREVEVKSTEVHNKTHYNVSVRWRPPTKPNGATLSFQFEFGKMSSAFVNYDLVCVPNNASYPSEYYVISVPGPTDSLGEYRLRIRSFSIIGESEWSEYVFFELPVKGYLNIIYFIVIGFVLLLLLILLPILWRLKKVRDARDELMKLTVNPDYFPFTYEADEWEIDRDKIELQEMIGQGSFGEVFKGFANDLLPNSPKHAVAVKTVHEKMSVYEQQKFLHEASLMKQYVDCHHVVKLIGVVSTGQPVFAVMELMLNGDLKSFLYDRRPNEDEPSIIAPSLSQILQMACEIADGMAYLADKKYVHCDLAARNCMVAEDETVKIGDFGMTRDVYERDYFRLEGKTMLPVRWMAPESLKDGLFTTSSDVWSYGVVLWEMATLAEQPYQGLDNREVLDHVVSGGLMERPTGCPDKLHDLMISCWQMKKKNRPGFTDIVDTLKSSINKPSFFENAYCFSEQREQNKTRNKEKKQQMSSKTGSTGGTYDYSVPDQISSATYAQAMVTNGPDDPAADAKHRQEEDHETDVDEATPLTKTPLATTGRHGSGQFTTHLDDGATGPMLAPPNGNHLSHDYTREPCSSGAASDIEMNSLGPLPGRNSSSPTSELLSQPLTHAAENTYTSQPWPASVATVPAAGPAGTAAAPPPPTAATTNPAHNSYVSRSDTQQKPLDEPCGSHSHSPLLYHGANHLPVTSHTTSNDRDQDSDDLSELSYNESSTAADGATAPLLAHRNDAACRPARHGPGGSSASEPTTQNEQRPQHVDINGPRGAEKISENAHTQSPAAAAAVHPNSSSYDSRLVSAPQTTGVSATVTVPAALSSSPHHMVSSPNRPPAQMGPAAGAHRATSPPPIGVNGTIGAGTLPSDGAAKQYSPPSKLSNGLSISFPSH